MILDSNFHKVMETTSKDVVAVIVTYNPDFRALEAQIRALEQQVGHIVVVDNASTTDVERWSQSLGEVVDHVIKLSDNFGIGFAQNRGIEWAKTIGAQWILLMDQDSLPELGMVEHLFRGYSLAKATGVEVGAVGSRIRDHIGSSPRSTFLRYREPPWKQVVQCDTERVIPCNLLIASGTLIPLEVLDQVGLMNEGMFIDLVDTEWCLRAEVKGYRVFGVCDAVMQHSLGLRRLGLWFFMSRDVSIHAPFRYYYMIRNGMKLLFTPDYGWAWRWFSIQRLFMIGVLYGFVLPGRSERLWRMVVGFWDGLRGFEGRRTL